MEITQNVALADAVTLTCIECGERWHHTKLDAHMREKHGIAIRADGVAIRGGQVIDGKATR